MGKEEVERPSARRPLLRRAGQLLMRGLAITWLRVYHRCRIVNPPRIEGAYVVVANHASFLDPIVLGATCPRVVGFLMNSLTYRSPTVGWFYRLFESIPVDPRGGNRDALRAARDRLARGEVVGVFPEGGISRDGGLLLGNTGAVSLVLSSDVAIVPCGLRGVSDALPHGAGLPWPSKIEVHFGDPIPAAELMVGADRKERLAQATARLMREIGLLTEQESREDQLKRLEPDSPATGVLAQSS